MSKLKDKEIPSTGAVPKTGQDKNKRSKNKNKYPETEIRAGASVQIASGDFEKDRSMADRDIGPESAFEEPSCKRRYKCVTFILEDEGISKKSKDDPMAKIHESRVFKNSRMKKQNNRVSKDGGNQADVEREASTTASTLVSKEPKIKAATKAKPDVKVDTADENNEKDKDTTETETNSCVQKRKKPKRSKRSTAAIRDVNNEPVIKIRKGSIPEDELTADLANLHIGPNRTYLTNLLEHMAPPCPKLKMKTHNRKVAEAAVQTDINSNVSSDFNLKKVIKWTRKRWNKDRKATSIMNAQHNSVVVHNLPMTMISVYHQKLTEVFEKLGRIKCIGFAEVLPETDGEMFNTTIYFETEEAATKALEEDFSLYGSVIRVSRPLPPTETTAVARSYSQLPIDELRAIFGDAGQLRCVHAGQRRSGRMTVAFLEFDGPEAVQRALALSGTVKVNGKLVYVNKFEVREKDRWPGKVESNRSTSPISTV